VGQEIVYFEDKPVWSMSYAGCIPDGLDTTSVQATVKLLHAALTRVSVEEPYRGPRQFVDGSYTYTNHVEGAVANFFGTEIIAGPGGVGLEVRYGGGFVR
jgi:hypothetical protein